MTLEAAAASFLERLHGQALWSGGMCSWMGAPEPGEANRAAVRSHVLGPTLYHGSAGIAVALAAMARVTGDEDARKAALGGLRHAYAARGRLRTESRLGLFEGLGGVLYAAVAVARALDCGEAEAMARELVREFPAPADGVDEHDLVAGAAGGALALWRAAELLRDPAVEERARRVADWLVERRRSDGDAIFETVHEGRRLGGLAHGSLGIAFGLWPLAATEPGGACRRLADDALAHPFAFQDGTPHWCNGSGGYALAHMRAGAAGGGEARAALDHVRARSLDDAGLPAPITGLCHGLAGSAEILRLGHETFSDDRFLIAADAICGRLEEHLEDTLEVYGGDLSDHRLGLMTGMAGEALAGLRTRDRELPSPLWP